MRVCVCVCVCACVCVCVCVCVYVRARAWNSPYGQDFALYKCFNYYYICISDAMNKAEICGKSIKYVTSHTFLFFIGEELANVAAHPRNSSSKEKSTFV